MSMHSPVHEQSLTLVCMVIMITVALQGEHGILKRMLSSAAQALSSEVN